MSGSHVAAAELGTGDGCGDGNIEALGGVVGAVAGNEEATVDLLTLHIRRRRYLDAEDRSVILSEFPLKADGTSISPEFADFLKRRS